MNARGTSTGTTARSVTFATRRRKPSPVQIPTPKRCATCGGKGWVFFDPKPRGAFWFERTDDGGKPVECTDCDTMEHGA